ncbi:hypothetical protein CK203_004302 [Vitis vinifera]|uniref:Uncharacterized protein n=1 Tax=Vitis vinifera TaxID=29760 RepID=A0A438K9U2_VITVI|nr:hypothetical protein CK203_004302 [Vitis vinifera]
MEQRPVIEETKYLNEAVALQKIMFPSEVHGMLENKITQDETPLEIPDNNPFKKRKLNEIYLDQIPSITEQISVVVDVDNSDIMCVTLESQESVDSKPNKVADRKAISKNEKRKRSDCKSSESSDLMAMLPGEVGKFCGKLKRFTPSTLESLFLKGASCLENGDKEQFPSDFCEVP